ncbi:hypothetical protein [Mucilaginibacter sp.]|uniref:hypothetical protein n=1 Tax=Mucilaginibacter sp. TaxID=1882438 RepID=UPI003264231A
MRNVLLLLCIFGITITAKSQIWQPGHYTDVQGVKYAGIIRPAPGGKGPFPGEGYIEFKDSEKGEVTPLSTSDLQSFIVGQDSFVVAKAPVRGKWTKMATDFVRIVMNADVKIYTLRIADGKPASYKGSGHIRKLPAILTALGNGTLYANENSAIVKDNRVTEDGLIKAAPGYLQPVLQLPTYTTKASNSDGNTKKWYYYGSKPSELQYITDENFKEAIAATMKSQPKVVDYIRANPFGLDNIERLIAYFYKVKLQGKL